MEEKFISKKIFRYVRKKSQMIFSKRIGKKEMEKDFGQKKYYPKVYALDKYKFMIFVFCLFLIPSSKLLAQTSINYYGFDSTIRNSYLAITGGTVLASGLYDSSVSAAIKERALIQVTCAIAPFEKDGATSTKVVTSLKWP